MDSSAYIHNAALGGFAAVISAAGLMSATEHIFTFLAMVTGTVAASISIYRALKNKDKE